MANLTSVEKLKFENVLGMRSGYVLDFTNRTFQEFVAENVDRDIYDEKYGLEGGSKANRLRAFWNKESASLVGKLLCALLDYLEATDAMRGGTIELSEHNLREGCKEIAKKLMKRKAVEDIDALTPNADDKNFQRLAESIKESIEKDEPEAAIDRLHTFVVRYVRELCKKHSIEYGKNTALHSLFGSYIKFLRNSGLIESGMTEKILKSSIEVLEAFNGVRNNQSFAHDNPILNYDESILIFNNISHTLRFLESLEQKISKRTKQKRKEEVSWADIPYSEEEIEAAGDAWVQSEIDRMRGK